MKIDEEKWYVHHIKDKFQNNNEFQIYLPRGMKTERSINEQSFAEKHPILANVLQAELAVAGMLVGWFLVTFFYHLGYFFKWNIPVRFMEIDLIAGTRGVVVFTYIFLMIIVTLTYEKVKNKDTPLFLRKNFYLFLIVSFVFWQLGWLGKYKPNLIVTLGILFFVSLLWEFTISNYSTFSNYLIFFICLLVSVPFAVGYSSTGVDWPIIYKNGKSTNQVIVSTYRDYFVVGYYKEGTLYPCYRLVKMVDDNRLNETEVTPKLEKKVFKYSEDRYQISEYHLSGNPKLKPGSLERGCPNF